MNFIAFLTESNENIVGLFSVLDNLNERKPSQNYPTFTF